MKRIATLLPLLLALTATAPVAGGVLLTPTTAKAAGVHDFFVDDLVVLLTEGRAAEAAQLIEAEFLAGRNLETALGLLKKRFETLAPATRAMAEKTLKEASKSLPEKILKGIRLPGGLLFILPPADALTPVAGRGGHNDET